MVTGRLKQLLASLTGTPRCQGVLERLVGTAQWLMGIGSGSVPESSGEQIVVKLLEAMSLEGSRPLCIFDVGANRGEFSTILLKGLRTAPMQIHAFEPSPATFHALTEAHGSDARVILNQTGLGREIGSMTLYSDRDLSGFASVYRRRLDHFGLALTHEETIAVDTLDAYCARHHIDRIDLLKVDVEGHELDVLHGAHELFRKCQIAVVTFEFGGCNIDSRSYFQDFHYFFKEHGDFDLFRITPSGYLSPVVNYTEAYEQFRTTNFLARSRH